MSLAALYESVLIGVARIRSGRGPIQNADAFRSRTLEALGQISRSAAKRGLEPELVDSAQFAVVALLDESILNSPDLKTSSDWEKHTLAQELYGLRSAGEVFFERLGRLQAQRDSPPLSEVLEVYYLCLLMGYEGRYSLGQKAELRILMENLRERIERISGHSPPISPDGLLPADEGAVIATPDPLLARLRVTAAAGLVAALVLFVVFQAHLHWLTGRLASLAQAAAEGR